MIFGRMAAGVSAAVCWSLASIASATEPVAADVSTAASAIETSAVPTATSLTEAPTITGILPAGTVVFVTLDADLSTMTAKLGDRFPVVVFDDVIDQDTIVIPKGAPGYGEVTFTTNKGAFGKPGIIGITLRQIQIDDRQFALSGRYREEGANNNGATAATMFAVGIFSAVIKGKPGIIQRGRKLKAHTGEPIAFIVGIPAPAPQPIADTAIPLGVAAIPAPEPATTAAAEREAPARTPPTETPTGGKR